MKTLTSYRRQSGFFDFGLSLVLLTVVGTTATVMTTASEQEPQEVVSYSKTVED